MMNLVMEDLDLFVEDPDFHKLEENLDLLLFVVNHWTLFHCKVETVNLDLQMINLVVDMLKVEFLPWYLSKDSIII